MKNPDESQKYRRPAIDPAIDPQVQTPFTQYYNPYFFRPSRAYYPEILEVVLNDPGFDIATRANLPKNRSYKVNFLGCMVLASVRFMLKKSEDVKKTLPATWHKLQKVDDAGDLSDKAAGGFPGRHFSEEDVLKVLNHPSVDKILDDTEQLDRALRDLKSVTTVYECLDDAHRITAKMFRSQVLCARKSLGAAQ